MRPASGRSGRNGSGCPGKAALRLLLGPRSCTRTALTRTRVQNHVHTHTHIKAHIFTSRHTHVDTHSCTHTRARTHTHTHTLFSALFTERKCKEPAGTSVAGHALGREPCRELPADTRPSVSSQHHLLKVLFQHMLFFLTQGEEGGTFSSSSPRHSHAYISLCNSCSVPVFYFFSVSISLASRQEDSHCSQACRRPPQALKETPTCLWTENALIPTSVHLSGRIRVTGPSLGVAVGELDGVGYNLAFLEFLPWGRGLSIRLQQLDPQPGAVGKGSGIATAVA